MEKIQPGKFVDFAYTIYKVADGADDEMIYETPAEQPEQIIFGVTQGVFPPLEKALDGLTPGETFSVTMAPEDAFGEYDPERVVELEKEIFEVEGKFDSEMVKVGAMIPMMNAAGQQMYGRVLDVTDKFVKMDFNHILAGETVRFDGKVIGVREATQEELHPVHGCGGCCGGSDDGCGCGEGCGEGCGCN
ncbi:MAG: FKBP-type peptidyl-prolyl cis-trans isomerase [Clostridium sp.]|nr:FKBP-type peptidyl-prolyl cis-trans isomerase [Clostridium sp.]